LASSLISFYFYGVCVHDENNIKLSVEQCGSEGNISTRVEVRNFLIIICEDDKKTPHFKELK